ncbi:hypothetical protein GW17_00032829 [Ensete ventricosum]|nr:hypothetical protein GW17_00032829 [Ensete ventricosum]
MQWDLVGSSLGDSSKESGSLLGTRREITRKKTGGLATRLSEVARVCGTQLVDQRAGQRKSQVRIRKVEGTTLAEISTGKLPVSDGWTTSTTKSGRQLATFDG